MMCGGVVSNFRQHNCPSAIARFGFGPPLSSTVLAGIAKLYVWLSTIFSLGLNPIYVVGAFARHLVSLDVDNSE